jgi:hypothetical protein
MQRLRAKVSNCAKPLTAHAIQTAPLGLYGCTTPQDGPGAFGNGKPGHPSSTVMCQNAESADRIPAWHASSIQTWPSLPPGTDFCPLLCVLGRQARSMQIRSRFLHAAGADHHTWHAKHLDASNMQIHAVCVTWQNFKVFHFPMQNSSQIRSGWWQPPGARWCAVQCGCQIFTSGLA